MPNVIEKTFDASHVDWKKCAECIKAVPKLSALAAKYPEFNTHLKNVFETRSVSLVFSGAGEAHFKADTNTLTVPHSGNATDKDVDDLVDAFIFESYNAVRRDRFMASKGLQDHYDFVGSGKLIAETEAGTMTDFYALARAMTEGDRTENMKKCILRAAGATGEIGAHFLSSPHVGDPEKLKTLTPGDERRLPTAVVYIYQNIRNAGTLQIRCAILTKIGVAFDVVEKPNKFVKGRTTRGIEIKTTADPPKTAAISLDTLVEKNWPSASFERRPGVLLQLIHEVQTNTAYSFFRMSITETAFGFTAEMKQLAGVNAGTGTLKT